MSIETFDPLNQAFLKSLTVGGMTMNVPYGYSAMRGFMESPAFIDHLADALHAVDDHLRLELECYCRRISTEDGTKTGPQSDNWDSTGKVYDPADWGVTDPPLCEQTAAEIVARMLHR